MSETKKKIGIVGCGAIGGSIARAVDRGELNADLAGLCDIDTSRAQELAASLQHGAPVLGLDELAEVCDIMVEAAQVSAVAPVVEQCLSHGRDLMVMSVGGLTEDHFSAFERSTATLYVPSGAVCGLDGVLASNLEHIDTITLTTRKPPAGLKDAPYIVDNNISLDNLTHEKVVFEGSPADAIQRFPKNINVSTTLATAAAANGSFKVRIIADPDTTSNTHEIDLRGALGNIRIIVENVPSPENPKTSALAYYSAIATLRKIISHVKIGT